MVMVTWDWIWLSSCLASEISAAGVEREQLAGWDFATLRQIVIGFDVPWPTVKTRKRSRRNPICRVRSVWCAIAPLIGVRNGQIAGMR